MVTESVNVEGDILKITLRDTEYNVLYKRECGIKDRGAIAEMLLTLKAFGLDISGVIKKIGEFEKKQTDEWWL